MKPYLTTITPYWNRPAQLSHWLKAIEITTREPYIHHLLYVAGEEEVPKHNIANLEIVRVSRSPCSIGHYHNLGARKATTPWIMKLDVDAIPNVMYFQELLHLLEKAEPREWFNGGMLMMNRHVFTGTGIVTTGYQTIMANRKSYSTNPIPVASNFICRTEDYLSMGGCDERFKGYGWEDYQQIYGLERNWLQKDPLPGPVTLDNVIARCREEISRRKAKELLLKNPWLCLIHQWHPNNPDPAYRAHMQANKRVLFDYIQRHKANDL